MVRDISSKPARRLASAMALLLAASLAGQASAEIIPFRARLDGASEVPAVNSAGRGELTAAYDTATRTLTYQGRVSGLTGEVTAAHFHGPAVPGQNAGALIPVAGVQEGLDFKGSATLTDDQAAAVMAGRTYFNVHTAKNPDGEVRGQLTR